MPPSLGYHHGWRRTAKLHQGNHHDSFFDFIRHGVLAGVRQGRWKLLRHQDKLELYDLQTDPQEATTKAETHAEIVQCLTNRMKQFEAEVRQNNRPAGFLE
jgi:arylsulfatase A-like enzyme